MTSCSPGKYSTVPLKRLFLDMDLASYDVLLVLGL